MTLYEIEFIKQTKVTNLEHQIAKQRLLLFQYIMKIGGFEERYAARLANGTFFSCNTNYRAVGGREFDDKEAGHINCLLDSIDGFQNAIFQERNKFYPITND